MNNPATNFAIDAVITWVDGSDPKHAEKLNAYLSSLAGVPPKTASKARFHHAGELEYCVTSILKFAPWIRTIYIVTDEQVPSFITDIEGTEYQERIKVIDHKIIFADYPDCLPTFNSMAITTLLWKIPNLAEKFIYFNDDFMLLGPVKPSDFFLGDGVVLRGKWKLLPQASMFYRVLNSIKLYLRTSEKMTRVSYWKLQERCAELLEFKQQYFRLPHNPHAWRKTSWASLFVLEKDAINENIVCRLRSATQFVPESLSAHFELKTNAAEINNSRTNLQLKPAEQSYWRIKYKLAVAERRADIVFGCVQSIELASLKKQQLIFLWLDKRIGSLKAFCTNSA